MEYDPTSLAIFYFEIFQVEIAANCGFYLNKNIISYVELMTTDQRGFDWKNAVAIVLQEVYKGDWSLANYCALGYRATGRPGICRRLFAGLYSKIFSIYHH